MNRIQTHLLIFLLLPVFGWSQVDDAVCVAPNKRKTQKLIEKAKSSSDFREAVQLFQEAIKEVPENATPYYEFGLYAYEKGLRTYKASPNPKAGDKFMIMAKGYFKKTIEKCYDYHASCFYYLGIINYMFNDKEEAIEYFKKFKAFDNPDANRYAADYSQRIADVKEVLASNKEEQQFLDNPVPFSPKIVENVSSERDEYFPMISPDNSLMFFTRRADRTAKGDIISTIREEFTLAKRTTINSPFDRGTPLPLPFNDGTFENYGASTLSVDNKEMILCACKMEKVQGQMYKNCDLYITYYRRKSDGSYLWTPLKNLGDGINTNTGWEGQPSLSADGNVLYFTANRPTTQNDDIFYAERLQDGTWGPAKPFTIVNTQGKDKSPFIHQDSQTFYFVSTASDSRKGLGGTDIFYMRKDENGNWTKPKNIGYPINTKSDEIGLFVSISGEKAFFSSRQKGNWNIYEFDLYEKARPEKVKIIKGKVDADELKELENLKLEIAYSKTGKIEEINVNGNDGKYAAVVHVDTPQDIMINVKKEGYAFESRLIEEEELSPLKPEVIKAKDMEIKKIKSGEAYTINDILFATASAQLTTHSKFILKQFGRYLKNNTNLSVIIQGHTDDVGDDNENLLLSEQRAKSVRHFLIEVGVEKDRLKAKGYGETQPKVANSSEKNRRINRRTDFVIETM